MKTYRIRINDGIADDLRDRKSGAGHPAFYADLAAGVNMLDADSCQELLNEADYVYECWEFEREEFGRRMAWRALRSQLMRHGFKVTERA